MKKSLYLMLLGMICSIVLFGCKKSESKDVVKVLESVCEELDAMVVSLIEQSPKWEPATLKGKPIPQGLKLPIVFEMR